MKKMKPLLISCFAISTCIVNAQSQNWWRTNGNTPTGSEIFGTTNAQPINFYTNNTLKMVLDVNGNLRLVSFTGSGNRLLLTDANGNITPFTMGTSNQVLFGNGTWGTIPTQTVAGVWGINGNKYFYNGGNVGIGTSNPQFLLDVGGDMRVQNNLYVGGGLVLTDRLNAAESVTTTVLNADTIRMGVNRVIAGTTDIVGDVNVSPTHTLTAGDVITQSKLTVQGNATFSGNLKSTNLATNGGNKIVYVDSLGNLKTIPNNPPPGANAPCVTNALPWHEGGNMNVLNQTIGTCSNQDFILKAFNNNAMWVKPVGNIGVGQSNPTSLFEIKGNSTNSGLKYLGSNNAENAFEIALANAPAFSNYRTYTNGQTFIGKFTSPANDFDINGSILTIGAPQATNKILSLVKNTSPSAPTQVLNVFGSGVTEIFANTANSNDEVFTITDANTTNKNFSVRKNGVTEIKANTSNLNDEIFSITDVTNANKNFRILKNGNVIIGNTTGSISHPNSELMVKGTIIAKELYVTKPADWPDYVFKSDYKLLPLTEVESFYKTNKHLPNVPSEAELEKMDLNLGEMNKVLLHKIEELTLYTVEQNKKLLELQKEVEQLKKK